MKFGNLTQVTYKDKNMSKLYESINNGFNRRYLKEDESVVRKSQFEAEMNILKEEAFNDAYDYISKTWNDFKDAYEGTSQSRIALSIFLRFNNP